MKEIQDSIEAIQGSFEEIQGSFEEIQGSFEETPGSFEEFRALLRRDRVNMPLLHECIDRISLKYSVKYERYVRQIMLWGGTDA